MRDKYCFMVFGIILLLCMQRWSQKVRVDVTQGWPPSSSRNVGFWIEPAETDGDEYAQGKVERIVAAARYTWQAYDTYAFGYDELKPISKEGTDNYGGLGLMIVDSLDTLWMLDMQDEYEKAVDWVVCNLTFDKPQRISMFETNIRVIGGLLSASQLANDTRLLDKAADLASRFLPAFDTDTGIPHNWQRLPEGAPRHTDVVQLADVGTFTLEFATLTSELSLGRLPSPSRQLPAADAFADRAEGVVKTLMSSYPKDGLLPSQVFQLRPQVPPPGMQHQYSVGGPSDSYYEYLLKLWILKGKGEDAEPYRAAWERVVDEAISKLYFDAPPEILHYMQLPPAADAFEAVGAGFLGIVHPDSPKGGAVPRQEHLACFFPGNIILGLMHGAVRDEAKRAKYESAAANVTHGCWAMYAGSRTGLAPEALQLIHGDRMVPVAMHNCLRPEVVESLFYMWRWTHNARYRRMAWSIFRAFEENSKVPDGGGYTGLNNAALPGPTDPDDGMPSYWMSETLKYLWLMFSPDSALDLEAWVLNTEAHPLRVLPPHGAQQQ